MEVLSGLLLSGYIINDKLNNENEVNNPNCINFCKKADQYNIYDSRHFNNGIRELHNMADDRYKKSINFEKTKIIPNFYNKLQYMKDKNIKFKSNLDDNIKYETTGDIIYNQKKIYYQIGGVIKNKKEDTESSSDDSEFTDIITNSNKSETTLENHTKLLDKTTILKNNEQFENDILERQKNMTFLNQFDDLKFNETNKNPGAKNKFEIERNLALTGGYSSFSNTGDMTYGITDPEQFTHTNMIPFVSTANKGYGIGKNIDDQIGTYKKRKLDLFSGGADNLDYRPKTERKPLFNPLVGLSHMHGMPNFTDYQEQYFVPSKERRNEKLFEEMKVTPGLNLGYFEVSKAGAHDPVRIMPKDVNELRPGNKPKVTYGSVVIPGKKGDRRSTVPNMVKNNPITFWELDRPLNGQGEIRAPTVYGDFYTPPTARSQTSRPWAAPAEFYNSMPLPEDMIAKSKLSFKQNYNNDRAGQVGGTKTKQGHAFDANTGIPDLNMRNIHNKPDRAGQMSGNNVSNKGHAYSMTSNIPDMNMRNVHNQPDRAGNPSGHNVTNKSYAFDELTNAPSPNLRNIHNQPDRAGQVGGGFTNKNYVFDDFTNAPSPTLRNVHNQPDRAGNPSGHNVTNKSYAFNEFTNAPSPTLRNVHNQPDRAGNPSGYVTGKGYAFNEFTNAPSPTLRNVHSQPDRAGNPSGHITGKGYAFNEFTNAPSPTLRNVHSQPDRAGNPSGHVTGKGYAFNEFTNAPSPTLRNVHSQPDRAGNPSGHVTGKGYAFNEFTNAPSPTLRNIHSQPDRAGNPSGYVTGKGYAFNEFTNAPSPTLRNIHNKPDRAGQVGGDNSTKQGHAFDFLLNSPDATLRDIHAKTDRAGHVGNNNFSKHQAFDTKSNIPSPTLRNIHENPDRAGQIGNKYYNKPQAFDMFSNVPDATLRDIHADVKHIKPPIAHGRTKTYNKHDFNNALLNVIKEKVAKGRKPTDSNYTKCPIFEHTIAQLCNPLQVNRELYPDVKQDGRLRSPVSITRQANVLPQQSWRFYSHVDKNVKNNPFINNMVHKAELNA